MLGKSRVIVFLKLFIASLIILSLIRFFSDSRVLEYILDVEQRLQPVKNYTSKNIEDDASLAYEAILKEHEIPIGWKSVYSSLTQPCVQAPLGYPFKRTALIDCANSSYTSVFDVPKLMIPQRNYVSISHDLAIYKQPISSLKDFMRMIPIPAMQEGTGFNPNISNLGKYIHQICSVSDVYDCEIAFGYDCIVSIVSIKVPTHLGKDFLIHTIKGRLEYIHSKILWIGKKLNCHVKPEEQPEVLSGV